MKKLFYAVALDTHCCCCQEMHCSYLLSNRSQSHRMRQTIHVAPSICPLSASYFRGGYVPPPSIVVTTQLHAYWGSTLRRRLPRHLQTPYVCEESSSPFYVSSCPVHATRSELEQGQICYVNDQERIQIQTQ